MLLTIGPQSAHASVVFVQTNGFGDQTASTTLTQSFGSNNSVGNTIVVALAFDSTNGTGATCSDTRGNRYQQTVSINDSTNKQYFGIYYATNIASGPNTVTCTSATSNITRRMIITEYSGVSSVAPVDRVNGRVNQATSTTPASNNVTPMSNGTQVIGVLMTYGTTTFTAGTNFTKRLDVTGTTNADFGLEDQTQGTAASIAGSWTLGATQKYSAFVLALRASDSVSDNGAVQNSTNTGNASATTLSTNLTNVTAGNAIVVAAAWSNNSSLTCSDNGGNTYTTVTTRYDSTNLQTLAVCYATNIVAGSPAVTMTIGSAATKLRISATEYNNIATSNALDVYATNGGATSTSADAATSTALTTTGTNELIFGAFQDTTGASFSNSGTNHQRNSTTAGNELVTQDYIKTAAGSIAATQTYSTSADRYLAIGVAFKSKTPGTGWLSGWSYRRAIAIDHTKTTAALTNFTAWISLTSANMTFANAQSNGYDIRFTSSDGTTLLNYERSQYVQASSVGSFWVKIPAISNTVDTTIYVYYGNASAPDGSNKTAAWDANTLLVYHFDDDPTVGNCSAQQVCDSTGNANNGSANGTFTAAQKIAGKQDNAWKMTGSSQEVDTVSTSLLNNTSQFTMSMWIKPNSMVDWPIGQAKYSSSTNTFGWQISGSGDGGNDDLEFNVSNGTANAAWTTGGYLSNGAWTFVQMVFDGTQSTNANRVVAYVNGIKRPLSGTVTWPSSTPTNASTITMGSGPDTIDNAVITNNARSAAWALAQFNSENNTFATVGAQVQNFAPTTPSLGATPAYDNLVTNSTTPVLGSFASTDADGDRVQYEIQWSTDATFSGGVTTQNSAAATGFSASTFSSGASATYQLQPGEALSDGTTYWWRVRARDPLGSNSYSSYSSPRSLTVNTTLARNGWLQTTDAQFATNSLSNTTTSGSGSVRLTAASGSVKSTPMNWYAAPTGAETWDTVTLTANQTTGTIKVSVYYTSSTSCDTLVPDADLPGNASGFDPTASPIDISGLNPGSYTELCLMANMTGNTSLPTMNDWMISFKSNAAPNAPTSLDQYRTDNSNTIAVGQWTNTTDVTFSAQATDQDTHDSLSLCVEARDVSTGFSADLGCGTPIGYNGSAVTVTFSTTLAADKQYHWQARVKDNGHSPNLYSSYVSFGGNSDLLTAAADIGIDTSAPIGGTVYDGTSAGTDAAYNTGALDTLSANWSGFDNNVSGLNKYQYAIGSSAGAVDVKTWTDNGVATSASVSGLALKTGQTYYFSVRALDNAGNTSQVASSDGQIVAPSLSFSLNTTTLAFDRLNSANSFASTKPVTMTTSTNASGGYKIYATQTAGLTDAANTISAFDGGTYASPNAWLNTNRGLGYTTDDALVDGVNKFQPATCPGGSAYVAPGCFAPFSTGTFDVVADHPGPISTTPVVNEVFTMSIKVQVDPTASAGSYIGSISMTAVASF